MAERKPTGAMHTTYKIDMAWAWNEGICGINLGDLRQLVEEAADMADTADVYLEDVSAPNEACPTEYRAQRITVREEYDDHVGGDAAST